jgi:hypothetical protein
MRNFTLVIFFIFSSFWAQTQTWSIRDLAGLTFQNEKKVNSYLSRKGFNYSGVDNVQDTLVTNYSYIAKRKKKTIDSTFRFLNFYAVKNHLGLTYQTSSKEEAESIVHEISAMGFIKPRQVKQDWPQLFQKNDVSIVYTSFFENEDEIHSFRINRNNLPPAAAIRFAEDLLVIQSHEQLRYVYGDRNVKKENYFFSEESSSPCSVLYPNTSQQAIFLWDDTTNYYRLSFVLIGGGLQGESAQGFNEIIGHNTWHLKSGLRTGISIQDLIKKNGKDFNFYGYQSPFFGIIVPETDGNIDFKSTGFKLNCLNCSEAKVLSKEIVSAERAISDNRRLFVNTIILHSSN